LPPFVVKARFGETDALASVPCLVRGDMPKAFFSDSLVGEVAFFIGLGAKR